MTHLMPLTARQADRMNRIFRLGIYERKQIQDYPILHRMLTNLFHAAYESILGGKSPKLGFYGPELVAPPFQGKALDLDFWDKKIGSYSISNAFTSAYGTTLDLRSSSREDIFLPDTFCLLTNPATFTIDISSRGTIRWIEIICNEDPIPIFMKELIRDFPGHNAKSDKVTVYEINHRKIGPDSFFTKHITFGQITIIEV